MNSEITPKLGVIDIITTGFQTLLRYPWLLLVPILLDVLLWFGPQLSIKLLIPQLIAQMALPANTPQPETYAPLFETTRDALTRLGDGINLFTVLANNTLSFPSFFAKLATMPAWLQSTRLEIATFERAFEWLLFLYVLSILLGAFFLALIPQCLHAGQRSFPQFVRSYALTTWRLFLFLGFMWLLLIMVSVPAMLIAAVLTMLAGPAVMALLLSLLFLLAWWVQLALIFVVPAIAVDEVNVRQAMWRSINVVTRNLWSTIGLIFLLTLISAGFSVLWAQLAQSVIGTVVGIVGNAIISTGLLISTILFYRNRYRRWQAEIAVRNS